MEQQTTSTLAAAPQPGARASTPACCAAGAAPAGPPPRPLDLTGMTPPGDLRAARIEEFTIDGICGVY